MAMYHDQATTPFHSLYTEDGVVFTAGMPIIRTAADVTPEFCIAGVGEADETSFRHAVYLAVDAYHHRNEYDEAREIRFQSFITKNVMRARKCVFYPKEAF